VGAACVPIQGLGICTYAPKDDGEKAVGDSQPAVMEVKN
jgi:hypothetical protein